MTIKDPVCGMTVWYSDVLLQVEYQGEKYFFCAAPCRDRFVEAPERYAHERRRAEAAASSPRRGQHGNDNADRP